MANVAGITVGTGHILISPQLHPSFGSNLNSQMGAAGRTGGTNLANGMQATSSSRFGALGRHLGGVLIAGFAAAGIAKGISKIVSTGIGEVKDYQTGLAQLTAGIKSTGGAVGITAGQMEDLASSIQKNTGQTDDSIVASEQLLLTFTKVTDQAGKGNDIFTQTTKISADMAARLGGDASSAAIKLGKALQDPVLGVSSLARVGVVFDAGQKKQIKTMVAAGNTLGAQKIILAELTKEFGGSAVAVGNTLPGQIEKGKRAFEDMSQSVVTLLVPALSGLVSGLASAVQWAGPGLQVGVKAGIAGIRDFAGTVADFVTGPAMAPVLSAISAAFRDVGTFVTRDVLPSLKNLWGFIAPVLIPVLKTIGVVVVGTIVVGFRALGGILTSVVGPALRAITGFFNSHKVAITSVAIALGGLVVGWKLYRLTQAAWFAAQTAYAVAMRVSQASITSMRASLTALNVTMRANPVLFIVTALIALGVALVYAYKHSETFRNIVQAVFRAVTAAGQWMWDNVLKPIWAAMQIAWQVLSTAIKWYWDNYAHPVINAFAAAGSWLWNTILKPVFGAIGAAWNGLMGGLGWVYYTVLAPVWRALDTAVHGVATAFDWVKGAVKKSWDALVEVFKAPIRITFSVINTFDTLVNKVLGAVGITFRLPTDLKLASGGGIRGYGGGDIVPAILEPGEFVVRKEAVRAIGVGGMEALNARHYAAGGAVMSDEQLWASVGGKPGLGGAAGDVGKWVLDKAQHWLRAGAANMLDAGYQAILKPVLGLLGSSMPAKMAKGAVDTAEKKIIGWIRGQEHQESEVLGNPQAGPGQSFGLIIDYLRRSGVPFSQADPGVGRGGSSYHEYGQAVDFSGGDMTAMANVWERVHGSLLELIHSPSWFVKNGRDVGAGFYGPEIVSQHFNHVHVAASPAAMQSLLANATVEGHANGGLAKGWSLVGERRPELINAGSGSRVISGEDTARLFGGRGPLVNIESFVANDRTDIDLLARRLDWQQRQGML